MDHRQDGDRSLLGCIAPAFAPICQYLSSTVLGLAPSTFSSQELANNWKPRHVHERNNPWKQILDLRGLERISLSDDEKVIQAEG